MPACHIPLPAAPYALPIVDTGHRLIGVKNDSQRWALARAIEAATHGDMRAWLTFDFGSTTQTILSDGMTVINEIDDPKLSGNGASFVVDDPGTSARIFEAIMQAAGYTAVIHNDVDPNLEPNKLVLVETNVCSDCAIVFRRHSLAMGDPPNFRRGLH